MTITPKRTTGPLAGLTERQIEVGRRLLSGAGRETIAKELGVSRATVDRHIERLRDAVGAPASAVAFGAMLYQLFRGK